MRVWLRKRLVRDAHLCHQMWSFRIAVMWAIVSGLWIALPAFEFYLPPIAYAFTCIGFSLAILVARVTHQPGLPDV